MKTVLRHALACMFSGAVALGALPAFGAISVGDKPELKVAAAGGGTIDLEKYKGKIIILDFWATWCGPCMAEAPHMVATNTKYASKGLQIIGISSDNDVAKMQAVAKEKGFVWPQHIDKGEVGGKFGVTGIPHVFLIGPEGTVLWDGHPANMDQAIEKAFKEHPPQLVDPKLVKQAMDLVAQAEAKMEKSDAPGAIKLMSQVPKEAKVDKDLAAKVDELNVKLTDAAQQLLAEVDPLIEAKNYIGAVARLKELSTALAGSPVATQAKGKLTELSSQPEVKAAIEHAKTEKASGDALDAAKKLRTAGKNEQAYPKYKSIVTLYPGTAAATEAAKIVKDYEKDAAFVHKVNDEEAGTKAKGALSVARNYAKLGKVEQAHAKYESIIKDFAGTSVADTAKEEMAALAK